MGCSSRSDSPIPDEPLSMSWPWLVAAAFFIANQLFHSVYAKSSEKRHHRVMRLFRFCADRKHTQACSVYGHLLLFRGETDWHKQQGLSYLQVAAGQGEEKAALQYASAMIDPQYGVPCDDKLVIRLLKQAALNANVLAAQKLLDFLADRGLADQMSAQEVERISQVADLAELNIR